MRQFKLDNGDTITFCELHSTKGPEFNFSKYPDTGAEIIYQFKPQNYFKILTYLSTEEQSAHGLHPQTLHTHDGWVPMMKQMIEIYEKIDKDEDITDYLLVLDDDGNPEIVKNNEIVSAGDFMSINYNNELLYFPDMGQVVKCHLSVDDELFIGDVLSSSDETLINTRQVLIKSEYYRIESFAKKQ